MRKPVIGKDNLPTGRKLAWEMIPCRARFHRPWVKRAGFKESILQKKYAVSNYNDLIKGKQRH